MFILQDVNDWVSSINDAISIARLKGMMTYLSVNSIYHRHCNNDFGLLILSQWHNIVLLQLNNNYNICS